MPDLSPSYVPFVLLCGFLLFILAGIVATFLEGKRDRLSGFSPGQQKALKLQNNALTCWTAGIFLSIFICPIVDKVSSALSSHAEEIFMAFGGLVIAIIAVSSMISGASILRPRGQSEFSKGKDVVTAGLAILLLLGLMFVWWLIDPNW